MLSVKNNLSAQNAGTQFKINQKKYAKSSEKLSSGYRINRSADDAAGLTISEKMRIQIRGLDRASVNIQEGISLIQVADGAMNEISDMLHRMKELSIQSANATNTPEDRKTIQNEIDSLLLEIDDIHDKTEFNEIRVLDGGSRLVGGSSSNGHYGQGYYVKGGMPSFITNSSGTTAMGHLSQNTSINYWRLNCTSITLNGKPYLGEIVASDGRVYQANTAVREPGFMGTQREVHGMDTLNVTNGQTRTDSITIGKNTYVVTSKYEFDSDKYASAFIDFSGINAGNIGQLVGSGFYTTCTMCDRRYSVEFVDKGGTGDGHAYSGPDTRHHTYTVDISGITDGNALIDKIVSVLGDARWNGSIQNKYDVGVGTYITSAKPNNHYSDYAAELDSNGNRTGRLMIISTGEERGSFINPTYFPDYGLFNSGVYTYGNNVWIPDPSNPTKVQGELHIQTGALEGDAVLIPLPVINCDTLGLDKFSVLTEQDSDRGITLADEALKILNDERSALGAWQNRLEHSHAIVTNTSENTQSAESILRDCDMAKTLVMQNIQNILMQAGMSVLAQANQQPQMLLNMLQ